MKEEKTFDAFYLMSEDDRKGITDSILIESGREVASARIGGHDYGIRVQGHVHLTWKGKDYYHPGDYPDDLVESIRKGEANSEEGCEVIENNWYELLCWNEDSNLIYSDVVDINLSTLTEETARCIFLEAEEELKIL